MELSGVIIEVHQVNYDIALFYFEADIHTLNDANFYLFLISVE